MKFSAIISLSFLIAGCAVNPPRSGENKKSLIPTGTTQNPIMESRVVSLMSSQGVQPPTDPLPYSLPAAAVSWDSQTNAAGYNIYYGTSPHSYEDLIFVTNNYCIITNLVIDMRYYFAATAVATNGAESDFSSPEFVMVFDGNSRIFRFFTPVQIQNPVVQRSRDLVNWSTISDPILSGSIDGGMDWFVSYPSGTSFFRLAEQ
jgi:hypothetical protein